LPRSRRGSRLHANSESCGKALSAAAQTKDATGAQSEPSIWKGVAAASIATEETKEREMSLPLAQFTDATLLLLRLMVAVIFGASGWGHLKDPEGRSKSIGMSKGFTIFLGAAELAAALGLALGVLTQFAAQGLILFGLGAIQKKIFTWHTGFWGRHGTDGWSYDLMLIVMNLVIVATGGGRYVLLSR
jgi:putative oxidoreductase